MSQFRKQWTCHYAEHANPLMQTFRQSEGAIEWYGKSFRFVPISTVLLDVALCDDKHLVTINTSFFIQLLLRYHRTRDDILAWPQDSVGSSVVSFGGMNRFLLCQLPFILLSASRTSLLHHGISYSHHHSIIK